MSQDGLTKSVEKMRAAGVADLAIRNFEHYYRLLEEGDAGVLPESEIEPVDEVLDADELEDGGDAAREALDRTLVLKLNGGLGTSMGMTRAKSLLEAKDGLSFLDVIARQVLHVRERSGARLPLELMNSFYTRDDSLAALARYPDLKADVPLDFVQGKVPKLTAEGLEPVEWPDDPELEGAPPGLGRGRGLGVRGGGLEPVEWPDDPELEWAPPGHGDLCASLVTSGML